MIMEENISPGDNCIIAGDIIVGGHKLFSRGESVVVEAISPNKDMPDFKYLVYSIAKKRRYQLRAEDLRIIISNQPATREMLECLHCGKKNQAGTRYCEYCGKPPATGVREDVMEAPRPTSPATPYVKPYAEYGQVVDKKNRVGSFSKRKTPFITIMVVALVAITIPVLLLVLSIYSGPRTPEGVVEQYVNAINEGDVDAVIHCLDVTCDMKEESEAWTEFVNANKGSFTLEEIENKEEENGEASIVTKIKAGEFEDSATFQLMQRGTTWRIVRWYNTESARYAEEILEKVNAGDAEGCWSAYCSDARMPDNKDDFVGDIESVKGELKSWEILEAENRDEDIRLKIRLNLQDGKEELFSMQVTKENDEWKLYSFDPCEMGVKPKYSCPWEGRWVSNSRYPLSDIGPMTLDISSDWSFVLDFGGNSYNDEVSRNYRVDVQAGDYTVCFSFGRGYSGNEPHVSVHTYAEISEHGITANHEATFSLGR